ncbi:MAG TPA: CBS domain-containing protein [Pirellulaceae bacterium]|nr:CBS domain-containing protein [Planctomycetales bacterium]MCB9939279.1 CBS domain-containing protein [Planctomycetaceae bacterium]HRX77539.1 CBS domain-containing protein [Pirellulaceae bacterium]
MSSLTPKDPDAFQDPLENYDPKVYEDPLEEALAEKTVSEICHEPFVTISPDLPVHKAVEKLAGLHVSCLLVAEEGKLLGVFSDRDVLERVALEFDAVKDRPVRELMTNNPVYVYETDSSAAALTVTAACGFRHVPVLDVEHKVVGIVSPQRVTAFLQQHFVK